MNHSKVLQVITRMKKEQIFVISIAAILVLAAVSSNIQTQAVKGHSLENPCSTCSIVEHGPIEIHGDSELQSAGFPGEGTPRNPYRIENLNITGDSTCIWMEDTSYCVEISGCYFNTQTAPMYCGIYLVNSSNVVVRTSTIVNKTYGVNIQDSSNCSIERCVFSNTEMAFDCSGCYNLTAKSNTITRCCYGIILDWSSKCLISGNQLSGNMSLIGLVFSNFTVISDNNLEITSISRAIDVGNCLSIIALNNTINALGGWWGIVFNVADNSMILNNTIDGAVDGINFYNSNNGSVSGNLVTVTRTGISVFDSKVNISSNSVHNGILYGIQLNQGPDSIVMRNNVSESGSNAGIIILDSDRTEVFQNLVMNSTNEGLYISSNSTVVRNNRIIDSGSNSIRVMYCNASIVDNYLEGCTEWGTILTGCQSAQILDNIHHLTGGITSQEGSVNSVIKNNTVIDSFRVGVTARNSRNCLIENNTIDNSTEPSIDIEYFSNSSIVRDNYVRNSADYGIRVLNSSDCIVEGNLIEDSKNMGIHTIDAESTGIFNNTVFNCQTTGIYIKYSLDTTVSGNVVSGSVDKDVVAYHSSSCLVFLNSFESSLSVLGENDQSNLVQWDNGTYGNYWANYVGHDSNFDGIGDTAYYVNTNAVDYYPLTDSSIVDVVRGIRQVPIIQIAVWHSPEEPTAGSPITFNITTTWIGWVSEVRLSYSVDGGTPISVTATRQGSAWMAEVPEQNGPCTIEYRVYVQDIGGNLISSDERVITIAGNGTTSNTSPVGGSILDNPMFLIGIAGAFVVVIAVAFELRRRG